MERLEFERKIERIVQQVRHDDGDILVPTSWYILCIFYGEFCDENNNFRKRIKQQFQFRYNNQEIVEYIDFLPNQEEENTANALNHILDKVKKGILRPTTNYYLCFATRMEDIDEKLVFALNGINEAFGRVVASYELDLYVFVGVENKNLSSNKEILKKIERNASDYFLKDIYLLSGETENQVPFPLEKLAVEALEMNVYLKCIERGKVSTLFREDFWKIQVESDNDLVWKELSYWKMDILICAICKFLLAGVEDQLNKRTSEKKLKEEVFNKIESFFEEKKITINNITQNLKKIPINEEIYQSVQEKKGLFSFFSSKISTTTKYTYENIVKRLWGEESPKIWIAEFFEQFKKLKENEKNECIELLFKNSTLSDTKEIENLLDEKIRLLNKKANEDEQTFENIKKIEIERPYTNIVEKICVSYLDKLVDIQICRYQIDFLQQVKTDLENTQIAKKRSIKRKDLYQVRAFLEYTLEENNLWSHTLAAQFKLGGFLGDNPLEQELIPWDTDLFERYTSMSMRDLLRDRWTDINHGINLDLNANIGMTDNNICKLFMQGIEERRANIGVGGSKIPLYRNRIGDISGSMIATSREYIICSSIFEQTLQTLDSKVSVDSTNEGLLEFFGINDSNTTQWLKNFSKEK